MSAGELDGRVVLITGGGGVIGGAIGAAMRTAGATVVMADVDLAAAEKVAGGLGASAEAVRCDVRDEAEVDSVVAAIIARRGRLDVAVANAGISGSVGPLVDMTDDDWSSVFKVNVHGTFRTLRAAGAAMTSAGGGALISTASIMGLRPAGLCGAYSASCGIGTATSGKNSEYLISTVS